jgi:hypothetical protein
LKFVIATFLVEIDCQPHHVVIVVEAVIAMSSRLRDVSSLMTVFHLIELDAKTLGDFADAVVVVCHVHFLCVEPC